MIRINVECLNLPNVILYYYFNMELALNKQSTIIIILLLLLIIFINIFSLLRQS